MIAWSCNSTYTKKDGLYYSWIDSYATDHNPIRVHTVHGPQLPTLPPLYDPHLHQTGSTTHLVEDSDGEDDWSVQSNDISLDSDSSSVGDMIDDEFTPPASLPTISPTPTPAKASARRGASQQQPCPVRPTDSLLAELWAAQLGHCEERQLHSYHSTPQVSLPNSAHILCALSTIKSKPASKNVVPGRQPPKPPNPDKASMSTLDFYEHLPATTPNLIRSLTALSHHLTVLPATYLWLINSPATCGSSFV